MYCFFNLIFFCKENTMSVLVGRKAPDFDVAAVVNGSQFVDSVKLSDFKGKYVVLFFLSA